MRKLYIVEYDGSYTRIFLAEKGDVLDEVYTSLEEAKNEALKFLRKTRDEYNFSIDAIIALRATDFMGDENG